MAAGPGVSNAALPWDGTSGRKPVTDRAKKTALDKALRGLFGKLQARPLPDRMMSVVDQLDAADQAPLKKSGSR
ncbi:MAG: hypothetical protein JWP86_1656 [Phenylobacterium sp.]|nr:hypothetical protein [Phenylobacterium sp.]